LDLLCNTDRYALANAGTTRSRTGSRLPVSATAAVPSPTPNRSSPRFARSAWRKETRASSLGVTRNTEPPTADFTDDLRLMKNIEP
jgi:hypothetical protein